MESAPGRVFMTPSEKTIYLQVFAVDYARGRLLFQCRHVAMCAVLEFRCKGESPSKELNDQFFDEAHRA